MQDWQKDRNYRKIKNPDGSFICIITVDGEDVEVCLELYEAYSTADRRERYVEESEEGLLLSLNRMSEDGTQLSYLTDRHVESAEDAAMRGILAGRLAKALAELPGEERELIEALFFDGVSTRRFAKMTGMYHTTLIYRRDKILEKLRRKIKG